MVDSDPFYFCPYNEDQYIYEHVLIYNRIRIRIRIFIIPINEPTIGTNKLHTLIIVIGGDYIYIYIYKYNVYVHVAKIVNLIVNLVSYNVHCQSLGSIQHYVIKFVSDLRQVSGFLQVLRFPPPIKQTATIYIM